MYTIRANPATQSPNAPRLPRSRSDSSPAASSASAHSTFPLSRAGRTCPSNHSPFVTLPSPSFEPVHSSPTALTTRSSTSSSGVTPAGTQQHNVIPAQCLPRGLSRGGDPAASNHPAASSYPDLPCTPSAQSSIPPIPPGSPSRSFPTHLDGAQHAPKSPEKRPPLRLKSFLEKTLTARETRNSPPPKAARSQTPHHSGSASSSLVLWETVGVTVFRSKRCPAARRSWRFNQPPKIRQISRPPPDRAKSCTPGRHDRR